MVEEPLRLMLGVADGVDLDQVRERDDGAEHASRGSTPATESMVGWPARADERTAPPASSVHQAVT
jgi:hypothetical protein